MLKITGKQSKSARALLKWNLHDLVTRLNGIQPRRIDNFEHGNAQLLRWENDELVKTYKHAGIIFRADMEVALKTTESDAPQDSGSWQGEGARIVLDSELKVVSDSSDKTTESPQTMSERLREEELKQKQGGIK